MIVVAEPDRWLVVTQADHARLAAEMLRLFRLPELVAHPRRDALLEAIAAHDDGWWEADAAPTLDGVTGGPADFRALAADRRREIWRRGVERHAERAPYVAALAASHLLRLLATWGGAEWGPFRAELAARRDEIATAGALDPAALGADDAWLRLGDDLSLAACCRESSFVAADPFGVEVALAEGRVELAIDPFPLAGATRLEVAGRWLPGVRIAMASSSARRSPRRDGSACRSASRRADARRFTSPASAPRGRDARTSGSAAPRPCPARRRAA